MANKTDQEWLVDKIVEHGLHLVKLEELIEAYEIARSKYNNPIYCQLVKPGDIAKDLLDRLKYES